VVDKKRAGVSRLRGAESVMSQCTAESLNSQSAE